MAEADPRLSEAVRQATAFLDCPATLVTLARLAAKKALKEELRAQGIKLTYIAASTLAGGASCYLREHPELIGEAAERIRAYPPLLKLAQQEARDRLREKGSTNSPLAKAHSMRVSSTSR